MTDDEALLRAITDQPDEDTPRLVYADYLDEQGQHDRAEFIRVQVELAQLPANDPRRNQLYERQAQLLHAHHRKWLPSHWHFSPYHGVTWRRGFITGVEKLAGRVSRKDRVSLKAVPTVERLFFNGTKITSEGLQHLPALPNLREFFIWAREGMTPASFALLSRWPTLRTLRLCATSVTNEGLNHLETLHGLRSLAVEDGVNSPAPLTDAGLHYLAGLTNLEGLALSGGGIAGPGLDVLSKLPQLRKLVLRDCGLTESAVAPLVACAGLEELNLDYLSRRDGAGDQLIAALPQFTSLRTLSVLRSDVTATSFSVIRCLTGLDTLAVSLASDEHDLTQLLPLERLRRLWLHTHQFTREGLASLVALPNLCALKLSAFGPNNTAFQGLAGVRQLRWLEIEKQLTDDDLARVAELTNLEVLRFRGRFVTDKGITHLKRLPGLRYLNVAEYRGTEELVWDRRTEWVPQSEFFAGRGDTLGPTHWASAEWLWLSKERLTF